MTDWLLLTEECNWWLMTDNNDDDWRLHAANDWWRLIFDDWDVWRLMSDEISWLTMPDWWLMTAKGDDKMTNNSIWYWWRMMTNEWIGVNDWWMNRGWWLTHTKANDDFRVFVAVSCRFMSPVSSKLLRDPAPRIPASQSRMGTVKSVVTLPVLSSILQHANFQTVGNSVTEELPLLFPVRMEKSILKKSYCLENRARYHTLSFVGVLTSLNSSFSGARMFRLRNIMGKPNANGIWLCTAYQYVGEFFSRPTVCPGNELLSLGGCSVQSFTTNQTWARRKSFAMLYWGHIN